MLQAACIAANKLPPIRESTDIAGYLTVSAAAELGLPCGIPVVMGAGDDIEFLGAGITEPGKALEHLGTTGSILACVQRVQINPSMRLDIYPSIQPDLWFVGGSTSNAGAALAWGQNMLYGRRIQPKQWEHLTTDWCPDLAFPLVFLPYLDGERCPVWNSSAAGVLFGLTSRHTRDDVMRSIFEGVAFSLKHIIETLEETGVLVSNIAAFERQGLEWTRIRASIYNRTIHLVNIPNPTALGAMLLAGVAIGAFRDAHEMAIQLIKTKRTAEPVSELVDAVSKLYALYKEVYRCNESLFVNRMTSFSQAAHGPISL